MPDDAIALRGVVKTLGGRRVLDGLSLAVPRGQILTLMGPSGVGKTVSIKHVLGLHLPDDGDVLVEGQSIPELRPAEVAGLTAEQLGVMLQGRGLFGSKTLLDNVAVALEHRGVSGREEREQQAMRWLTEVGLADHRAKVPQEVSVGMRTRASLARALALDAPILVLDDIEAGLDSVRANLVCDLIARVHAERACTVLATTHHAALAARLGGRTAVMAQGRIVGELPAGELAADVAGASWRGDTQFVHRFLAGDAGLDTTLRSADSRRAPDGEGETTNPDHLRLALLAAVIVALVIFSVVWLVPILRGDVSLNPFI